MSKDAYYFSHDSNAKDDPKCIDLIEQLGLEGYGIFWVLIEHLRDQPSYKYPLKLLPALARRYNTSFEKINVVVRKYELFEIDENEFFSLSLINRMKSLDNVREARSLAGKKGNEKRWNKTLQIESQSDRNVIAKESQSDRNLSLVKESKVKESKVKESKVHYAEFVDMTVEEYQKLCDNYSEIEVKKMIDVLDNYKGSSDKKYKNDYRAILSWVVERVQSNNNQPKQQNKPFNTLDALQDIKNDLANGRGLFGER